MGYDSWISEIYDAYDGRFKYWEAQHEIRWLNEIIKKNLGEEFLYDKNGLSKFKPLNEYEGYKREMTTTGRNK